MPAADDELMSHDRRRQNLIYNYHLHFTPHTPASNRPHSATSQDPAHVRGGHPAAEGEGRLTSSAHSSSEVATMVVWCGGRRERVGWGGGCVREEERGGGND
jgi:hypothetical protein